MSTANSQTDYFLQLYKELEYKGRRIYFPSAKENESIIGRLICVPQLKAYKGDLDYCRVVRNFLTHNPKVGGVYPIIPSQEMIDLLKKCIDLLSNPPLAIDSALPIDRIFTTTLNEKAVDVIKVMNRFTYTHVPVYNNNTEKKLVGIFSENTIFSYLCSKSSVHITPNTLIKEFSEFLPLDDHINEYFSFVPTSTHLSEIEELFRYSLRNNKLLAAVYFTKNGNREEPILAMMTHWDIIIDTNGNR